MIALLSASRGVLVVGDCGGTVHTPDRHTHLNPPRPPVRDGTLATA
jgi:hypothetical protein